MEKRENYLKKYIGKKIIWLVSLLLVSLMLVTLFFRWTGGITFYIIHWKRPTFELIDKTGVEPYYQSNDTLFVNATFDSNHANVKNATMTLYNENGTKVGKNDIDDGAQTYSFGNLDDGDYILKANYEWSLYGEEEFIVNDIHIDNVSSVKLDPFSIRRNVDVNGKEGISFDMAGVGEFQIINYNEINYELLGLYYINTDVKNFDKAQSIYNMFLNDKQRTVEYMSFSLNEGKITIDDVVETITNIFIKQELTDANGNKKEIKKVDDWSQVENSQDPEEYKYYLSSIKTSPGVFKPLSDFDRSEDYLLFPIGFATHINEHGEKNIYLTTSFPIDIYLYQDYWFQSIDISNSGDDLVIENFTFDDYHYSNYGDKWLRIDFYEGNESSGSREYNGTVIINEINFEINNNSLSQSYVVEDAFKTIFGNPPNNEFTYSLDISYYTHGDNSISNNYDSGEAILTSDKTSLEDVDNMFAQYEKSIISNSDQTISESGSYYKENTIYDQRDTLPPEDGIKFIEENPLETNYMVGIDNEENYYPYYVYNDSMLFINKCYELNIGRNKIPNDENWVESVEYSIWKADVPTSEHINGAKLGEEPEVTFSDPRFNETKMYDIENTEGKYFAVFLTNNNSKYTEWITHTHNHLIEVTHNWTIHYTERDFWGNPIGPNEDMEGSFTIQYFSPWAAYKTFDEEYNYLGETIDGVQITSEYLNQFIVANYD